MKLRRKKRKREKQVTDLCECHVSLSENYPPGLLSICVSCLVKALLKREGNEETQTEEEMALLSLRK
ncbi:uncharacterized protein MONOS_14638 [Monocercomonoides exilis]|uniref:uncharacterized protein n=1 Tax=Monocercomonoides exilis TaxID=2049356 RepID=UPI00355AAB62|nr:hypothetical protein MONOS_14638 [Monocercomonoides exilis]|eukprot:MONOS_14638.1-p1 / transcript=MONOS_14638.1 / gene=MONOS_14638 / organism=Monocercomonoides_exilis_PA203 / gene_product=unspecified product / transcript_product=unspecified product / location=Mono_scaffold01039:5203-5464(+) / protein_length=67 / sequence_SO=supercontig / SO=protein_coding / is_pseudo=false